MMPTPPPASSGYRRRWCIFGDPGRANSSKFSFFMALPYLVLNVTEYQPTCPVIPKKGSAFSLKTDGFDIWTHRLPQAWDDTRAVFQTVCRHAAAAGAAVPGGRVR